jgi:hypothetical protein
MCPPAILTAPQEPTVNDRSSGLWTYINSRGFPALTVPAGFTTSGEGGRSPYDAAVGRAPSRREARDRGELRREFRVLVSGYALMPDGESGGPVAA